MPQKTEKTLGTVEPFIAFLEKELIRVRRLLEQGIATFQIPSDRISKKHEHPAYEAMSPKSTVLLPIWKPSGFRAFISCIKLRSWRAIPVLDVVLFIFFQIAPAAAQRVPNSCTADVNEKLVRFIQSHTGNADAKLDNVMVCGTEAQTSFHQAASAGARHGAHEVLSLTVPTTGNVQILVEVVTNDDLDGVVTAGRGDRVYAYGQAYIPSLNEHRPGGLHFVAGIHDTHCSTHTGADDGWVVVNGIHYPKNDCSSTFNATAGNVERLLSASPTPLLEKSKPVDWWFEFKFNSASFPDCGSSTQRVCPFGGEVQPYKHFGQQFVYASSENATLQKGTGCAGENTSDPLGATFEEIYDHGFFYVVWNDQFYDDPKISGCSGSCSAPWGHSKGLVAWDSAGNGLVMQVTTPSWPASGSRNAPRKSDGNTLGCVTDDNVEVSQHFFALKINKDDLSKILHALRNSSVVTDPGNPQIVNNGGPADIQQLVSQLGTKSDSEAYTDDNLSSGVELISKPSRLNVPAWQFVSSLLGGIDLRAATWWANPKIYSTTSTSQIACWSDILGDPGSVQIATTGHWNDTQFGLTGGAGPDFNHAKIGVSLDSATPLVILGDMNQQGTTNGPNCKSSQNGRGGLFYVLNNQKLFKSVSDLISGESAPTKAPTH